MLKLARFKLIWSEAHKLYELYEYEHFVCSADKADWFNWLTTHTSFAFQGKTTHFTLLKETRKKEGQGYWYAYQRQGKRTTKRYIGRDAEVVPLHLEALEHAFLTTQSTTAPLLVPKFQLPCPPSSLVRRERLLSRLDAGWNQPLTLLTAPAGSGKTTLVAQWIAERKAAGRPFPPVAWISLEKNDNDLMRFWRYVITACGVFQDGCARTALHQLTAISMFPSERLSLEAVLAHFLNHLTSSACEGLLILDDYHVITSPQIHQTLVFFLQYLPASVHIMLLTRSDPAFPLARLRGRGSLSEIGLPDLRFSREETTAFFQQAIPSLQHMELIEQVDQVLEGWATGLRLFALSLRQTPTEERIRQHLASFVSGNRPLQEYFLEEILSAQSPSQQEFLLLTCFLRRLTAALCNRVTSRQDSATVLRALEQAGLFLERLEGPGQWYQYQTLFLEALRVEARRRFGEQAIQAVLLQASHWYEQEGLFTEAIELTLQAQEIEAAARLIERYLARHGFNEMQEFSTLRRWLEQLPLDTLSQYPLLCLYNAQVLSLSAVPDSPPSGTLAQIARFLQTAETSWSIENNTARLGEVYALHAYLSLRQGEQDQAYNYASQALNLLPLASQHWRGVCLNLSGARALSYRRLNEARVLLQQALAIWTDLHHLHGARSCTLLLATAYFEQGALRIAADGYRRVVQEAREVGDREDLVPALVGLAQLLYEWNNLEAAERTAQEARDISEQAGYQELLMRSTFILMRVWFLRGEKLLVQQHLQSLLALCSAHTILSIEVQLCQMHYWLEEGDIDTVQQSINTILLPEGERFQDIQERKKFLQIRLLLEQQKYPQACEELTQLREAAQESGRGRIMLEVQLLLVRLLLAEKREDAARQTLQNSLLFAHPEGYLRSFLDAGKGIATQLSLLRAQKEEPSLQRHLQTLCQAFGANLELPRQGQTRLVPLSRQEQRVLRLLVAELSYPEIARELTVSINTVKTQVNSIYRKLDVHSRREARAIVRELRLLSSER